MKELRRKLRAWAERPPLTFYVAERRGNVTVYKCREVAQ